MPEYNKKSFNVLSSFILKIIAILTMTVDHLGEALYMFSVIHYDAYLVFKSIGRIAMPLFCFMIVEGVIHTKSFGKYCLRLGTIGTSVLIAQIFMKCVMKEEIVQGNIFIDLLLGALLVKALMDKRIWIKLLAIIPLAIGIMCFYFDGYETFGGEIYAFPYYVRTQYGFLSILLILGFYSSYLICHLILNNNGMNPELYKGTNVERLLVNTISVAMIVIIYSLYYLLGIALTNNPFPHFRVYWFVSLSNWAIVSGAFVLLYSGLRGYNGKWFKYGQYLYYPLHLLVLYGIMILITGV